jgi:hypothetical protein
MDASRIIQPGNIGIDTLDDTGDLYCVLLVANGWLYLARVIDGATRSTEPVNFWVILDALPA